MTIAPSGSSATAVDADLTVLVPAPRHDVEHLAHTTRRTARLPVSARPALRLCRCGHEEDAHQHAGQGDHCIVCGSVRCRTFRRRTGRRARSSARR